MFTHSFGIWVNQYCNSDLTNWDMFILLTETRFLTFIKREKALKIPTGWKFNYIVVFEQFIRLFICTENLASLSVQQLLELKTQPKDSRKR